MARVVQGTIAMPGDHNDKAPRHTPLAHDAHDRVHTLANSIRPKWGAHPQAEHLGSHIDTSATAC